MFLVSGRILSQTSPNSMRLVLRFPAENLSNGKERTTSWATVTDVSAFLKFKHYFLESVHGGTEVWATAESVCRSLSVPAWTDAISQIEAESGFCSTWGESFWAVSGTNRWKTKRNNCFLFSAGLPSNTVTVHVKEHKPQTIHHSLHIPASPSTSLRAAHLADHLQHINVKVYVYSVCAHVCWLLMEPNEG